MTDRLTAVIEAAIADNDGGVDRSHMRFLARCVAAAIRADQTVRTVDELEALPAGTILQTDNGGVWERLATDSRYCWSLRGGRHGWDYNADMLARYAAPLVILYRPDQEVGGA